MGRLGLEAINGLGKMKSDGQWGLDRCTGCAPVPIRECGVDLSVWEERLGMVRESPVVWRIGWEDTGLSLELLYSESREGHIRLVYWL